MREFEISVRVYYEDTDFSGIVYHARYLHFFERGRTEGLRETGVDHTQLLAREEPLVFAVSKMNIEWIAPAKIDDLLSVRTVFDVVRGARMKISQSIHRGRETLVRAEVEAVSLSPEGRPRRVPADLAAKFTA